MLTMTSETATTIRTFPPTVMPVEAPVSDSKAEEGVGYAKLPHPLKEGTVVRCVATGASWSRHIVGKDYIVDSSGTFKDERDYPTPTYWGSRDNYHTRFIIVEDKPKFTVGDKVRAKFATPYCITRDGWTGIVVDGPYSLPDGLIWVQEDEGMTKFDVEAKYFDLVEDKTETLVVDIEAEPLTFTTTKPLFEEVVKRDSSQFRWDELTDEEKAELLLAHHEGKRIQHYRSHTNEWVKCPNPHWLFNLRYRVFTPEMEEEERKEEARKKISDLRSQIADLEATIH